MSRKLEAYIRLNRPLNCIMLGLAVIVGAVIASGPRVVLESPGKMLSGFITGFAIGSVAMITNDILDIEIDKINQPTRPLPSGVISIREAIAYSVFWCIIGIISAFMTGFATLSVAIFALALSLLYNYKGKRTGLPGNIMVSINVALPFVYGPLLVGEFRKEILVYILMIILANTSREIIKDIVDIAGDTRLYVRSLPIIIGAHKSALVASILLLTAVALSVLPYLYGYASTYYAIIVLLADAGFVYTAISVIRDSSRSNALKQKKLMLLWMLLGLLAFVSAKI